MKLNHTLKKNIRLIVEKYNHSIKYHFDFLIIKSEINFIEIHKESKENLLIKYNVLNGVISKTIKEEYVYDLLITLFYRIKPNVIYLHQGRLLTLDIFIKEECNSSNIHSHLIEYKLNWCNGGSSFVNIGGNRLEAEFYKGLLILTDDILLDKSNVIEIN